MLDLSPTTWTLIGLFFAVYYIPAYLRALNSPLNKVPTVGPSGVLTSYYGAFKSLWSTHSMVQEGYAKYYGSTFKIPMMSRWMIVLTGPQLYDELRKATDDELSFHEAVGEMLQAEFTLGKAIKKDPYHIAVVRIMLARNLGPRFAEVQEEIMLSISDNVPATDDWMSVPIYEKMLQVVSRSTNRLFVGLPICRNPDYRQLNIDYTLEVAKASFIIGQWPKFLRPLVGKYFTRIDAYVNRAIHHLGPMIEERIARFEQYGSDDPERPNDLIDWLLDYAKPEQRTVYDVTNRILTVNFAGIHTTTMGLTHVLYDLAAHPEYVDPLRQEVLSVLGRDDWNKEQIAQLRIMDSFIKESQRFSGSNALVMPRSAKRDITLSDGTIVPKGNYVSFASQAMHLDDRFYPNSQEFDGFRFSKMSEADHSKNQAAALSVSWTMFGGGRHSCPGRFFAIHEIKTMLSYILLNYDFKLEGDQRPTTWWFGVNNIPNQRARLLFRKRKED